MLVSVDQNASFWKKDVAAPLAQEIPRPQNFRDHGIARGLAFDSKLISYPRGCKSNPSLSKLFGPVPIQSVMGGSASLRETYAAFHTACGITFLDAALQEHIQVRLFAKAIIAELEDSKKQKPGAPGPHETISSRRCAITLLLPRATSSGSIPESNIIDGLACLVSSKLSSSKAKNRKSIASGPSFLSESTDVDTVSTSDVLAFYEPAVAASTPCTKWSVSKRCRVGVLCGESDVAGFLDALNVSLHDFKSCAACIFSFIKVDGNVGNLYVPLEVNASQSTEMAVSQISKACAAAQLQSGQCLLLPQQLLSPENAIVDFSFDFTSLQAEIRKTFYELNLEPPKVSIASEALAAIDFSLLAGPHFTRVVAQPTPSSPFVAADPNHSVGVLLNANEDVFIDFLRRCRGAVPLDPLSGEWPIYGVQPEVDEEVEAQTSVLWWKSETKFIGSCLSLFAPRQCLASPCTQLKNSHIVVLKCRLDPLLTLFQCGFWMLPCSPDSVRPAHVLENMSYAAFIKNMTNCIDTIRRKQGHNDEPNRSSSPTPVEGGNILTAKDLESDIAVNLALGIELHTPTTTCQDLYKMVDAHFQETQTPSNLHGFATNAMLHHDGTTPLSALFEVCSEFLGDTILYKQVEGRLMKRRNAPTTNDAPHNKRSSPSPLSHSVGAPALNDGTHLFGSATSRAKIFGLACVKRQNDWCLDLQDSEITQEGCEDVFTALASVLQIEDKEFDDLAIRKEKTWPEQVLVTLNALFPKPDDDELSTSFTTTTTTTRKMHHTPTVHVIVAESEFKSISILRYSREQHALLSSSLLAFLASYDRRALFVVSNTNSLASYTSYSLEDADAD